MRHRPLSKRRFKAPLNILPCDKIYYPVLAVVSNCYPRLKDRLPMYYSPVRHLPIARPV